MADLYRDQVFIGKINGSSCRKSRAKPLIQPHSSTRATPCANAMRKAKLYRRGLVYDMQTKRGSAEKYNPMRNAMAKSSFPPLALPLIAKRSFCKTVAGALKVKEKKLN